MNRAPFTTHNRSRTNRKREAVSQEKLKALLTQYEAALQNSGYFFTLIDDQFIYRAANEAYCRAHGKSRDEIVGRTVAEIWGKPLFDAFLRTPLSRCLDGHEVHYQARFPFPATGLRYFDVSLFPDLQGGSTAHIIAITRDVTNKCRTEQELRLLLNLTGTINGSDSVQAALESSLRQICDATGWVVGHAWLPVPQSDQLQCAASWYGALPSLEKFREATRPLRWKPGEGLAGQVFSAKRPRWAADCTGCLHRSQIPFARESGLKAGLAIPVVSEENVVAILEFFCTDAQRESERLMGVIAAAAPQLAGLIQHKKSEYALRMSEERLRTLIETANEVIFHLAPSGVITHLNRAFEEITGWTRNEWLGKSFVPLLHAEEVPFAREWLESIIRGDAATSREFRVRNKDGEYGIGEFTLTPEMQDGEVVGIFGFARDVTERRRAHEAIRASEEHYRELFHQTFRMQENLSRLSNKILEVQEEERARISRELHDEAGQALTAVSMNLALVMRDLQPDQSAPFQRIDASRQLLEQLMENVHRFARELRPAMLDDLGLVPALRSISKEFSERTGIRAELDFSNVRSVERLEMVHKTVIYRLVQESLNNVAKHAQARNVEISLRKLNGRIVLRIRDDGKGFQGKKRNRGKSPKRLGLLGMQERARLVGGTFSVESEPGKGTGVRVEIPITS